MERSDTPTTNYWHLLESSEAALAAGDFPRAEDLYHQAHDRREDSPGRVFLSEKIGDGLAGLWRRARSRGDGSGEPGRWSRRCRRLRDDFLARAEQVVRDGIRLAELRPEDDAETNQPILEAALYLVSRSRLFREEPQSAVPLVKGLFRTARRTSRRFDVQLVRHDIPLTEEDRLWLARRGGELIESYVEQEQLAPGSPEAEEWAAVLMQLLQPQYFGSTGRLEEERAWLEAVTADRFLDRGPTAVGRYRTYLAGYPEPGPRADEARVRLLEMLGNTERRVFPVPLYDQALAAMQSAGLSAGSAVAGRYEAALARIEFRRPDPGPDERQSLAWASLALEADGSITTVFWWADQPRDVAFWRPGDDPGPLREFLAPCCGRLIPADSGVRAALAGFDEDELPAWSVTDFTTALLPLLAGSRDLEGEAFVQLALAESAAWRGGWKPGEGHPLLEPPRSSAVLDAWRGGEASRPLLAGLVWLGLRSRIRRADPSLRAGIGELARRGDEAAGVLYDFLVLGLEADRAVDASFSPWTLPLLWTRPDPLARRRGAGRPPAANDSLPDLGRSDLTIVSTGDAASILAAWDDGNTKWRIVLDRTDRLEALQAIEHAVIGPRTLLPRDGKVHALDGALELLETLIGSRAGRDGSPEGLLALLHWCRLVETHNGDLLDHHALGGDLQKTALHTRYRELVDRLPRESLATVGEDGDSGWAGQLAQRVRKSGLVVGTWDLLTEQTELLDPLWGVFEGSDAAWVWLDSAAIHARLGPVGDIERLHGVLHRRGRRHLSVLTAATWQRTAVEGWLRERLAVFGEPYCLALTDSQSAALRLAWGGRAPDSLRAPAESFAAAGEYLLRIDRGEHEGVVLVPGSGHAAGFWNWCREQAPGGPFPGWRYTDATGYDEGVEPGAVLAVPVLRSLEEWSWPAPTGNSPEAWLEADRARVRLRDRLRCDCSLEVAALRAGPWSAVEILDPRWRRVFGGSAPGAGAEEAADWSLAGVRLQEQPPVSLAPPGQRTGQPAGAAAAQAWWTTAQGGEGAPTPSPAPPGAGVRLLMEGAEDLWPGLAEWLTDCWERGAIDQHILLVAETPPAGAAGLNADLGGAGVTAWPPVARDLPFGPVCWCPASALRDPELVGRLEKETPRVVLALELESWLPTRTRESMAGAHALRRILQLGAETVLLQTGPLPSPWIRFLERVTNTTFAVPAPAEPALRPGGAWLDCGEAPSPTVWIRRLRRMLPRLREALNDATALELPDADSGEKAPGAPERRLVPARWLARLAGLEPEPLTDAIRTLRWTAHLAGDRLSLAGESGEAHPAAGHSLLIADRFAVLEKLLEDLAGRVRVLLPLWWAGTPVGSPRWIDLDAPPVEMTASELALVDRLLLELGDPAFSGRSGLLYGAPAGLLRSRRRWLAATLPTAAVLERIGAELDLLRRRLADVMDSAVETGSGFLVETGLQELRDDERDFLVLGFALGLWTWSGPADPGAFPLVDLLTLADSPTARSEGPGWSLLAEAIAPAPVAMLPEPAAAIRSDGDGQGPKLGRKLIGGLRSWLPEGGGDDEYRRACDRVRALLAAEDEPGLLVLRGLAGSGRHEALLEALADSRLRGVDLPEIIFYCPDSATAAGVARQARRCGLRGSLDLRLPPQETNSPPARAVVRPGTVTVLCEIQRFDPETRYRIAQFGRGGKMLMTVDPVAATETWENLFLTTPRAADVVELTSQRRLRKGLWTVLHRMLPSEAPARPVSLRRGRAELVTDYAANLDQCLARMIQEHEEGRLPDRIRLVGAQAGDLDYLGSRIRDRGWLSIADKSLDLLLAPGACEMLAAATDRLAAAGALARFWEEGTAPPAPLLPQLLGPRAAVRARDWLEESERIDSGRSLADFASEVRTLDWAGPVLAHPEAAQRLERILAGWGESKLEDLTHMPLWEAWWTTLLEDLGREGPPRRRPLVALAATARPAGTFCAGGVYLCLGTEPPQQHYLVLSRMTDAVLILYQEQSPLPGDGGP